MKVDRTAAFALCVALLATMALLSVSAAGTQEGAAAAASGQRPALRVAVESIPDNFEPSMNISNVGQRVNNSIFDHFIKRSYWTTPAGDGGGLAPSVAESWKQISPTVWEFKIRQGVKFHDGAECTSEDIAFNFSAERLWGPKRMVAAGPSYFGTLGKVEIVDKYTVRIETKKPDAAFLPRFTTALAFVVPKKQYTELGLEKFGMAPIGTGPYKLAEFKPNAYIKLVAFDDYWGGKPPAESVTFFEIPEFAGRLTALFNGEVDIIANITPDQVDTIKNKPGFQLLPSLIENYREAVFNTFGPVAKDKRIRQALAYSVDRQLIVDQLWKGYSEVPRTVNFPAHGDFHLAERPNLPFNPDKAKALMKEAGYKGEEIIFRVNGTYYANYLEAAQIMQQMWKNVGLNVKIEVREGAALREGGYDIIAWSTGLQMNDPLFPLGSDWSATGPRGREGAPGRSFAPTKEHVDLMERLATTMDPKERRAVFVRIVEMMEEEMYTLPLFRASEFYGVRKGIEWKPYTFWIVDFGPGNLKFTAK